MRPAAGLLPALHTSSEGNTLSGEWPENLIGSTIPADELEIPSTPAHFWDAHSIARFRVHQPTFAFAPHRRTAIGFESSDAKMRGAAQARDASGYGHVRRKRHDLRPMRPI
jgi:hypothetical protein